MGLMDSHPLLVMAGGLKARALREGYSAKSAAARRGFAIHAYTGSNGSGKTLCMIHDTLASLEEGRPVLSTVRLLDYENPRPCPGGDSCDDPKHHDLGLGPHDAAHPLYTPFRDFRQLLTWRSGDVLMDEVMGVASSRESHSMPAQVGNFLMQLRRADVLLRWSCPNYARADKVIREVTQAVTDCVGSAPESSTRGDGTSRLWRDRRLFRWVTFDAFAFDEFSAHKRDTMPLLHGQWFWRPESGVDAAYSTLDAVLALASVTESGMCMHCGGFRSRRKCSCDVTSGVPNADELGLTDIGLDQPADAVYPHWVGGQIEAVKRETGKTPAPRHARQSGARR